MGSTGRVAFYLPNMEAGGAQRVTVNLVNALAERGVGIDLVVSYRRGEFRGAVDRRVRVVDLGARPLPVFGLLGSVPALRRYLVDREPDVLVSAMTFANVVAIVAARAARTGTRILVTEHTPFGRRDAPKDRATAALATGLYRLADGVIAVSAGVAESVIEGTAVDAGDVSVVHNPIVTAELVDRTDAPTPRGWAGADGRAVVLGVGRLAPEKDFRTLVAAVARLVEAGRDIELVVLGEGPERDRLEATAGRLGIADRVSFPGYVENPYAYMSAADVFALSSRREGLPTVLVEAMACGCPVVATDCESGPREILCDGEHGPLVPVGDPAALANALAATLDEPPDPARLRARADDFSAATVTESYLALLRRSGPP